VTLAELATCLNARAAGLWRVEATDLVQVAFWSALDLDNDVAEAFSRATQRVDRSRTELGIVGAVVVGIARISVARDLSAEKGSGYWLRQFDADRSIAVPLVREGVSVAVASVAIRGLEDDSVIARVQEFLESWAEGLQALDSPGATFQNG
jgi:hypothetical protein